MTPDAVPSDPGGLESIAEVEHVGLEGRLDTSRRTRAPDSVDDPVRGDGVARFEQQAGEDGALTLAAERQLLLPTPGLERAEHPQIQGGWKPVVTSVPLSVHAAPSVSGPSGEYRRDASQNRVIAGQRPSQPRVQGTLDVASKPATRRFRGPRRGLYPHRSTTDAGQRQQEQPCSPSPVTPAGTSPPFSPSLPGSPPPSSSRRRRRPAKVGPNDTAGFVTPTRTVTVATVDWSQLAITAVAAAAIGVAATLAIQLVVHRAHRHSMAHA